MRIRWMAAALAAVLLLAGCGSAGGSPEDVYRQQQQQPGQQAKAYKQWDAPPEMQIDPEKQYFATIRTEFGDIRIELFAKDAPKTVNNFVFLAREGFYDGVVFHRIIKNFMIQTGDPTGTGTGGPGYRFEDELPPRGPYDPGIVAMANAGPNTNGSQFFICNGPLCGEYLNSRPLYTQFGKVVEGMDVVQAISNVEVEPGPRGEFSKPKDPPVIKTIVIEEK